jgi:alkylation response protein AidB-like acyl-CoA dehydrogenase
MDVRLSSEQQALRDAAAKVLGDLRPRTVAQLDDHERFTKLDAAVAASGWRELRLPADGGAPLASAVEACIVAEELGRGLGDVAFTGQHWPPSSVAWREHPRRRPSRRSP